MQVSTGSTCSSPTPARRTAPAERCRLASSCSAGSSATSPTPTSSERYGQFRCSALRLRPSCGPAIDGRLISSPALWTGSPVNLNDAGQYAYYGKVGGVIVTGNEDGIKHVAMNVLYSLQHLGCVIPPQADAGLDRRSRTWTVVPRRGVGWVGERVHPAQYRVHDVEPDAPGQDDQACRWHPRAWQLAFRLGRRRPLRHPSIHDRSS